MEGTGQDWRPQAPAAPCSLGCPEDWRITVSVHPCNPVRADDGPGVANLEAVTHYILGGPQEKSFPKLRSPPNNYSIIIWTTKIL